MRGVRALPSASANAVQVANRSSGFFDSALASANRTTIEILHSIGADGIRALPPDDRASANASQLVKRSSGFFASALSRTFLHPRGSPYGSSGGRVVTFVSITTGSPVSKTLANGTSPVTSSQNIAASAYWSVAGPCFAPRHCSGAM